MNVFVKDNFNAHCILNIPEDFDSLYPKRFTFNLVEFFNDIIKIDFVKLLSEFNRIDDLYVFIGNLEGEDIYKLDVKKVINLIQKNYFVGNKLSSSTIELFSQFNPHYNSLCSLYRAVLFLTKSDILCEFNKDNNGKSNRKANPIYAQVLLNNIAQEISFPPLPYASTLYNGLIN